MNASRMAELRDSLLALYECARALEAHEVAYHALAAALHAAEDLHDAQTLKLVGEHARRHLDLIEPGHRVSPQSAAKRGHPSVFEQLIQLADAACVRLKSEAQVQQKGRPQAPLHSSGR